MESNPLAVRMFCRDCLMWGTPFLARTDTTCGNCGSVNTVRYVPEAEVERLERERAHPPPELLDKWMQDELADFKMVMDHCSTVYDHFTCGRISKPATLPSEVIAVAEELEAERLAAAEAERDAATARADRLAGENARLREAAESHVAILGPCNCEACSEARLARAKHAALSAGAGEGESIRLTCYHCGKPVSTPVPASTIFRAVAECPECVGGRVAAGAGEARPEDAPERDNGGGAP